MRKWIFLQNPFITATNNSYRAAKKIGDFTNAALKKESDAFYVDQYNITNPQVDDYGTQYSEWIQKLGTQMGGTSALNLKFAQLSGEKAEDWDIGIQVVYKSDTPEYLSLLPNHRTPFQAGSQEDRMTAVDALSLALTGIVPLAAVKLSVDAFKGSLHVAFNAQKGLKSTTKEESNDVENARIVMCNGLYQVLGNLIGHLPTNTDRIADFFDLQTIRNHEQTSFRHNVNGGTTINVLTHTFTLDEQLGLENRLNTGLRFYLAAETNDPIGSTFVEVAANESTIVNAATLGAVPANRFLKVMNMSPTEKGAYTVTLL